MPQSVATPIAREIAMQLIRHEGLAKTGTGAAAVYVCEKLRSPLTTLTGAAGFRSLLARALTLAKRGDALLEDASVKEDGSLEGLERSTTEPGGSLLVAEFLGLLIAFIGDGLTMRLLNEIWPDVIHVERSSLGKE